uniref:hypothetical protein n=1 Tax=Nonomuraea sp. CA-251285 TaxID=3240002 RepID=UPI003F495AB2
MAKRTAPDSARLARIVEVALPSLPKPGEPLPEKRWYFVPLDNAARRVRKEFMTTLAKAEEWLLNATTQEDVLRCVISDIDGRRLLERRPSSSGRPHRSEPQGRDERLIATSLGVLDVNGFVHYNVERLLPGDRYSGAAENGALFLTTPALLDLWVQESNAHGLAALDRREIERAQEANRVDQVCGPELAYINGAMEVIGAPRIRATMDDRDGEVSLHFYVHETAHVKALGELLRKAGVSPVPVRSKP